MPPRREICGVAFLPLLRRQVPVVSIFITESDFAPKMIPGELRPVPFQVFVEEHQERVDGEVLGFHRDSRFL